MGEIVDIHPLVEEWLTQQGYEYIHEYRMPIEGRVDFFATHLRDHHTLLIEAKAVQSKTVIQQILKYGQQIPNALMAIAIPKELVTDELIQATAEHCIQIIPLEYEIPINQAPRLNIYLTPDDQSNIEWLKAYYKQHHTFDFGTSMVLRIALGELVKALQAKEQEQK